MAHLKLNTKQWLTLGEKLGNIDNGRMKVAQGESLQGKYGEATENSDELECHNCDGKYSFNNHCGAHVCEDCDDHKGLARCYCGWSASGDDGYRELSEGGECPI
jgi:hypothetical protein